MQNLNRLTSSEIRGREREREIKRERYLCDFIDSWRIYCIQNERLRQRTCRTIAHCELYDVFGIGFGIGDWGLWIGCTEEHCFVQPSISRNTNNNNKSKDSWHNGRKESESRIPKKRRWRRREQKKLKEATLLRNYNATQRSVLYNG